MIKNIFSFVNDHPNNCKADKRKTATRSLSLSLDHCLHFDTEIELFLDKYVKPFQQVRNERNKRHQSTNSDSDSGHSSFDSATDSILSRPAVDVSSKKFLSHKIHSFHGKAENRAKLVLKQIYVVMKANRSKKIYPMKNLTITNRSPTLSKDLPLCHTCSHHARLK